jgi:hypothetical protein
LTQLTGQRGEAATVRAKGGWNPDRLLVAPAGLENPDAHPEPDILYFFAISSPSTTPRTVGPVVLEIPLADEGALTGIVDDCWQTAIEDFGPARIDEGNAR